MKTKKRCVSALLAVLAACCLLAMSLYLCETRSAYASTNTDGTWQTGQTQNLIPTLHEGDVREQGWNIDEPNAQAEAAERDDGWAILASDGDYDLGNSDYTGGVYYVIELSAADQAKAQVGQLSISGSARAWIQGASANHHLSIRAEFFNSDDISGVGFHTETATFNPKKETMPRTETIAMEQRKVPSGTVKIKMWFSNQGSLSGKPWLGSMACYLHDSAAPSFEGATLDDTGIIDPENHIAIEGNTVKYRIQFNEKVFVEASGIATLNLDGQQFVTSSTTETIDENGKTSVRYSFTLPESNNSGTLSLSSISGLKVKDEAGNEFTYSGSPSVDTLQYYGTMSVTTDLTNIDKTDGENTAHFGTDYSATLRAAKGYDLPASVEIKVGGVSIASNGYTYDSVSGKITIYGSYIKGDISIKAVGIAKESTVTFDKQNGSGGTDNIMAVYDSPMPDITAPLRTGYTFDGYYTQSSGNGTKYYNESGKGLINCDFDMPLTLYAHWIANRYTIEFDGNKPDNASGNVTGNTSAMERTYDDGEISLPSNDFALTGWTFQGWATSASGGVEYSDGQSVENLTADNGATVTLYAVWKANTYTVNYDANKPFGASGIIEGVTSFSSHTYDTASALSVNGFMLKGWTFMGWATSEDGEKLYDDQESVGTLVAKNGGSITLYAVWKANRYTVNYNANQPSGASGMVAGSTASSSHVYDTASPLTANGFTLTGWTFQGWTTSAGGEKVYDNNVNVSTLVAENGGSITLYAVWKANTYTVNYDSNKPSGASGSVEGSMDSSSHVYDTASALTANDFAIKGWTFQGWALSNDKSKVIYTDGQDVSTLVAENGGQITLYAVWKANSHTLTLNAMGGSNSGSVGATFDSKLPDIAAVPARYGYNFLGYFNSEKGGVQYYDADGKAFENKTLTVDDNIVLYAQWSPVTYTIELYSEGKYIDTLEGIVFGELTLPSAEALSLTRKNFDFVGWNMYDEQNWAMYRADTLYSIGLTGEQGGVVVLYASWQEKPVYSLFYDANGGIGAPATIQAHEEETIILSDTVPTRKNYTFLGWAASADSQTAQYYPGGEFTMGSAVVTLYAVWKHNPSLTYDPNGGSFVGSVEVSYPAAGETVIITSIIPELEGHVFEGWSEDEDAVTATYHAGEEFFMPETDTVLYAVWKTAQYTVTSEVMDGYTIEGLNESYSFGETASFSVTGTSPKVYINGELVVAGENGQYSFTVRSDTHVFVADGSKLSLIYSANGGSGAPSDNNAYNSDSEATISSEEPERLGYTFIGWSTDENAESAEYTAGNTIVFAGEDIILYAVWKANTYTVTYDANGGTGEMPSGVFTYGTEGLLSKNTFEKTGYTFVGWALSAESGTVYGDGAAVMNLCTENNGNITLYAVWEQTVTVITFAPDEGSEANEPISVAYGEKLSSDGLAVPVRLGYRFAGYYTQSNGEGEMIFDAAMEVVLSGGWDKNVTALTLYPNWIPIEYTVVYINGQGVVGEQPAVFGTSFSLKTASELGIIAPEGYHFAGWSTIPSGQTAAYADGQQISEALTQTDGDVIYLYAVFEADERFSVHYDANGGSNAPVDNKTYLAGETVSLSDIIPEREGYIFGGWSYDPNSDSVDFPYENGQFTDVSAVMPEGGMSLYAVWIAGDTLQSQIDQLKEQAASLAEAIASLENADNEITAELEQLGAELKAAQDAIAALDDTYATDEELAAAVNQLKELLTQAEAGLEQKINQVQENLDRAVEDLTSSISANKSDIEEKLAAVDSAYKAADALLNSDIDALKAQDGELAESIASLDTAYQAADAKLQEAINTVQKNLDDAVEELTASIATNKTEIEEKLAALDSAYKAADSLINSDIAALKAQDSELKESIAALDTAYKAADAKLQAAIDLVQENLDKAVGELNDSIATNKSDIEEKLAAVDSAYKTADALINSEIDALKAQDSELAASIAALDSAYQAADAKLQEAIDKVQQNLDVAVEELTNSIAANKTDIEDKLTAVDTAYKAADALINSDIAALKAQDSELAESIAALDSAYKAADVKLQEAIDTVQANLNQAVEELNDSIAANKSDIEEKLAAVDSAYKAADALINSDIAELKAQDSKLAQSIAALDTAYKAADEALWAGIRQVQGNLDALQNENEKTAFTYMIINIVLGGIAVILIVTLIVKAVKKKNSQQ